MKLLDPIGDPLSCRWILIQPVDEHDQGMLPEETAHIRETQDQPFAVVPVRVDWFRELAPWTAPAPFKGQPDFGGGAADTLRAVLEGTSALRQGKRALLGGYSLAGLFALWAGYQTDAFEGIAAVSPSVWYPGWDEYAEGNRIKAGKVYLSLGDREERTRNPVMSSVGDRIRRQQEICAAQGVKTILEWNEGNHFRDPDKRTAAGFAWLMKAGEELTGDERDDQVQHKCQWHPGTGIL